MAHIIPTDYRKLQLSGAHNNELDTLDILKKGLSNDYYVFHNVYWTRDLKYKMSYGEADFVVINKSGDVLVIEQKNSELLEKDGQLFKAYTDSTKNVANQIHRNVDNIRQKYGEVYGRKDNLNIDYLFYCPDYTVVNVAALSLEASRIVDGAAKDSLATKIDALFKSGSTSNSYLFERVYNLFQQKYEFYPVISKYVSGNQQEFERLSGGLIDVIKNLEIKPYKLCIKGSAGSGKSVVAAELYREYLNKGKNVLFLCYNRPLQERFKELFADETHIYTWYGLCDSYLKEQGVKLDYSKMFSDPSFWNDVHGDVINTDIPDPWLFDAVIVDEGQDFEDEWYEILKLFTKPETDMVWLEDDDQNIRNTGTDKDDFSVTYHARVNFRTPFKIAAFLNKVLPFDINCKNELPGRDPVVLTYSDSNDQPDIVKKQIDALLREGFSKDEIVILSTHAIKSSGLKDLDMIAQYPLQHYTGEYDLNGNQVYTDGEILFDSVGRFKGQQSPAVILIDVDPKGEHASSSTAYKLLYAGMTRATVKLVVIASEANKFTKLLQKNE